MGAAYGAESLDGLELLRERNFNIKNKTRGLPAVNR
jgi:hypothetical protein